MKKLLMSDMDSTMISVECIDELADYVGLKTEVSIITQKAMAGHIGFEESLVSRVALLKGLPEEVLQICYDQRIKFSNGAKELIQTMKDNGSYCVLVSGGFTFFAERVAKELGFDEYYANTLEVKNGKLTGKVTAPILGPEFKEQLLHNTCKKLCITAEDVVAVGDGANDLPMLLAAGIGVAYRAKPEVQEQVDYTCDNLLYLLKLQKD